MEQSVYKSIALHEQDHWWYLGMRRMMMLFFSTFLSPETPRAILDAGCGPGTKGEALARYGTVSGVDASAEAVALARRTGRYREVRHASVEHLPFGPASFEVVNCSDVLYHRAVTDDERAIREFARVLKPDGLLFLREAAYDWLRGHNDKVVWVERRYTKRQLVEKLERNGFEILRATYANCLLFPLALAVRTLERVTGRADVPEDIYKPPAPVMNWILSRVMYSEARLLNYISFPFGLSVVCVAKKRKEG